MTTTDRQSPGSPRVVGIGAAAGGLEAVTQLLGTLRPGPCCAYVLLQQNGPGPDPMMVEHLARETLLTVKEVEQGEIPQTGVVYVVPPQCNALFRNGRLVLVTAPPEPMAKPSINQFLISLAAAAGDTAVGILLSGTGRDGVAGLRAIRDAGGRCLVQKPETARFDSLPRAAIEAGLADHVLGPREMAGRLPKILELTPDAPEPDQLERLLQLLQENLKFDFTGYKSGTLVRRIRRREIATGCADMAAYLDWVAAHPDELNHLAHELLISVTAFFRDGPAFAALEQEVTTICRSKPAGSEIRVWIAGCASGEEACSIALLFAEALGERLPTLRVQLYATDIDADTLNTARRGLYSAQSLNGLAPALLQRYFQPVGQDYEIGKLLRDMIVYARHDLAVDRPFLRMDLISCRNVLIYFDTPLQARVLQNFHFALADDGCLFLGRSESITPAAALFVPLDRRERLFRKSGDAPPLSVTERASAPGKAVQTPPGMPTRHLDLMLSGLVANFALTAVLCAADGTVRYSVGQVDRFLRFPRGATRLTIDEAILPALHGELMALRQRSTRDNQPQRGRRRRVGSDLLRMIVRPLNDGGTPGQLILFLPETGTTADSELEMPALDRATDDELLAAREYTQALQEALAAGKEAMQALDEEARVSSAALQSTNEELETANEELQTTNEELVNLNEKLHLQSREYARLSEEYAHLYDALDFPILVFDRALHLTRFNAPAARSYDLRASSLQRPLGRLGVERGIPGLEALLVRTREQGVREETLLTRGARTLRLAITPGLDPAGTVVSLVVALLDVTDITQAQAALQASEQRLTTLMEKTTVIFAMKTLTGAYLYANQRFLEFFDIDGPIQEGQTDFQLLPTELAASLCSLDLEALRQLSPISGEHQVDTRAGRRHLRSVHQVLRDSAGNPTAFIVEAEDVTLARHAEEQLRITARVFDQAGEAILVTDPAGIIQTINPAFTRITGYSREEALGRPIKMLKSGNHSPPFYAAIWEALLGRGFWQGEIWNRRKNGEIYPEWLTINRVDDGNGALQHFVAVFSDITSIKDSQRKVEYLATHDTLTGLPNRALFHDQLRHALARARRDKSRVALMFIDLDHFKSINDNLGHDAGDELLRQAALRLKALVRDVDTVARLGGDEFTAVLQDADDEVANQVGRRILDDLATAFDIGGRSLFVSASVGIAFYPEDGGDSATLIKAADNAMYRAKEQGRQRLEFFKPEMHDRLLKRAALETALRAALQQNRLRLVYQPQFGLGKGRPLVGAEALLRWRDPDLGDISPVEFIPIAEASGLILEVGRVVSQLLTRQLASWRGLGLVPPPVATNVSTRCIREPDFAEQFLGQLAAEGVPAAQLVIEITESALLESSIQVQDNLAHLHRAGLGISIDDFGTGYSSLSYLKRLPLSELKIDKSFVDGLGLDREDEAISRAVLAMAQALGLKTVAEGVETERQLAWLGQYACNSVQGFLLAKPLEAEAFEDLIARNGPYEYVL